MKRTIEKGRPLSQPLPGPTPPLRLPEIQRCTLSNGLDVWLVTRPQLPMVTLHLVLHAGAERDRPGLPGRATMTAETLDAGTATLDNVRIAREMEHLGASFNVRASIDGAFLTLTCLTRHLGSALRIAAEVLRQPAFPEEEFHRRIRQRRTGLLQQLDRPAAIASLALQKTLYGPRHPYGNDPQGTPRSLLTMTSDDARVFWRACYRPGNGTLIAVGDIALEELRRMLERHLGTWKSGSPPRRMHIPPPGLPKRKILLVHKAGATHSDIRLGRPALSRTSPGVFAALVMNRCLGGQFSSRLNANLRERRGITYGAFSTFSLYKGIGPFVASAAVARDKTDVALREFLGEFDRMRDKGMLTEELRFAQKGLVGSLPLGFETPVQIAAALQILPLYGLPEDYFANYAESIEAVTLEDVREVAGRFLDSSHMQIVVVGDAAHVRRGLERLRVGNIVELATEEVTGFNRSRTTS